MAEFFVFAVRCFLAAFIAEVVPDLHHAVKFFPVHLLKATALTASVAPYFSNAVRLAHDSVMLGAIRIPLSVPRRVALLFHHNRQRVPAGKNTRYNRG